MCFAFALALVSSGDDFPAAEQHERSSEDVCYWNGGGLDGQAVYLDGDAGHVAFIASICFNASVAYEIYWFPRWQ